MANRLVLHPGERWASDTGCYSQPASYSDGRYFTYLRAHREYFGQCLFATAPDHMGDAAATLRVATPVLQAIRDIGIPAALVGQDGLEMLPIPWDDFDVLFIGGTTEWKLSEQAYGLAAQARAKGKRTHMGRVNSWRRFKAAYLAGFDSVDGTYLARAPDILWPRLKAWLDRSTMLLPLAEGDAVVAAR